ncbi:MAG TPA: alpha/beta fold hydrolase [Actinoplanes sp.]|nr:alpha/beta fold hydrolase [Actinoplanes sp.]
MPAFQADDGVEIFWEQWDGDRGQPPVLLHHGFIASGHTNWVLPGVVDALTATGRRVVAIDARGHGRSGKPHDPAFYGESRMARDVRVPHRRPLTGNDPPGWRSGCAGTSATS